MNRRIHGLAWLAVLVLLSLVAAACNGGNGAEEAEDTELGEEVEVEEAAGGEYSLYVCEPEHLVPTNTNETCGAEVLNALFTALVNFDPETTDARFGPEEADALAESIESDDEQTWTITLKDGWTFHNGEEVTAQNFVDAWNFAAFGPNAQGNSYFFSNFQGYDNLQCETDAEGNCTVEPTSREMSGLKAVDDSTIEVTLTEPFSQFPLTLGYTAFYPLPQAFFDDPEAFEEAPIGNGPFQMDGEWEHDQQIRVTRYEDYAGDQAKADAVEFRIYSDINTAYNDLLAGNLDIMDDIPPEQVEAAEQEFGENFITGNSSSFTYLGFPLYDPKFQNADLRHAFSMAIDRQAITDTILPDQTPAASYISPVVAGARENPCGEFCEFNPERAKELFDEAGGYEGTLTVWFNSGAGHDEWVQAVANQWREHLGIEDIQFQSLEFAEYLQLLDERKITGPFRLGWVMDYPSPQNYLQPIYGSIGSSNNFGYESDEFDSLVQKGNAAPTVEEGIDFYHQAEDVLIQDMPAIPMFFGRLSGAHSDNVSNVIIDAFTRISTADVVVEDE